jgi:CheY-like chemotaxis protein
MFSPIVVADDDAVGRELVSRVLEKAGHPTGDRARRRACLGADSSR